MIARFCAVLPFEVIVPQSAVLRPVEFQHGPYHVRAYAPRQGQINPDLRFFKLATLPTRLTVPPSVLGEQIRPADRPVTFDGFVMDDDPAVVTNLLQIDFLKDSFDRRKAQGPEQIEPTTALIFEIANAFLAQLRTLARAGLTGSLKPSGIRSTFWRVDYLTDEGSPLPEDTDLARLRLHVPIQHDLVVINESLWSRSAPSLRPTRCISGTS